MTLKEALSFANEGPLRRFDKFMVLNPKVECRQVMFTAHSWDIKSKSFSDLIDVFIDHSNINMPTKPHEKTSFTMQKTQRELVNSFPSITVYGQS